MIEWKDIIYSVDDFCLKLNLSIKKGELVSLLGPSGSGKSTALRIAAGFIHAQEGQFIIDGEDLTHTPASNRNLGIVFQNYALFPHLNVEENIIYGLKHQKRPKDEIKSNLDTILTSLKLDGYNKRDINSLSGGEKQRVALGRSLIMKPRLLLLDEPLSALDADLRKSLRREIRSIQRDFNITTLYVTHDQEEALSVSDRVALLKDGQLQQYSTPDDLYNRPTNIFTASFIGESNLINKNGETLFFRPEQLISGSSDKHLTFKGSVENREYLGHCTRGELVTECNNRLKVVSYSNSLSDTYHIPNENLIRLDR